MPKEAMDAFCILKNSLVSEPVMAFPRADRQYALITDAAKAYREAEAALAEAKEKNPNWSTDKDWICDTKSCPNLYRHARGEACMLKMEDMLCQSLT